MFKNILILLLLSSSVMAAPTSNKEGLSDLIKLAVDRSLDRKSAQAEIRVQESGADLATKSQLIPQITATAAYQRYTYDSAFINPLGNPVSNNGQSPAYTITVSYDLQKLFGPEVDLAKRSVDLSKIQEKIVTRDIVRQVKKSFYAISEIKAELEELNKIIGLFSKIDQILKKQTRIGIYNDLERKQFQVQQSILTTDFQTRSSDLDATYAELALYLNIPLDELKLKVSEVSDVPNLVYAKKSDEDLNNLSKLNDKEMLANLSRDYNISNLKYEKFNSTPLPSVYVRGARELPTMPSSDGYQTITEVGIALPIDGFFTRSAQKSQLGAKAEKMQVLANKALLEHRNQIQLQVLNLKRFKSQTNALNHTHEETKKLLDKSFIFYSQKRIDVLGTLDIFQKYLTATRNTLVNQLQIQNIDAELEYLVGEAQ